MAKPTGAVTSSTGVQVDAVAAAELLRQHVYGALVSKAKGSDSTKYSELVRSFSEYRKRVEREQEEEAGLIYLTGLLKALTSSVSSLKERKHDAIISEVLSIKLWTAPKAVREAVLELVSNLVVANSAFMHTCLQVLVYSFAPAPAPPVEGSEHGPWQPFELALSVQATVLAAVDKVLSLVPTAPTNVLPMIVQQMPHKLRDRNSQCMYLNALFSLALAPSGAPVREAVLTAVVEHLLSIDVEIRWEDIVDAPTGEEEEEAGDVPEEEEDLFVAYGMHELDINANPEDLRQQQQELAARQEGLQAGWEGAAAAHSGRPEASTSGRLPVDEAANKLDSMMELTFAHLSKRIDSGGLQQLWSTLLAAFERTILNTHRSKFTQYLIFYVCMKSPECTRAFLAFLLSRLLDQRQPPITRSACAAYIASFLARANFLSEQTVVDVVHELAALCQEYCRTVPLKSSSGSMSDLPGATLAFGPDTSGVAVCNTTRHQVFYASVQAILYVLCYHMEPIMAPRNGQTSQLGDRLGRLVKERVGPLLQHKLAPLTVCLPSVVSEFDKQAKALGLINCSSLLPQAAADQRAPRPLEMFFPFDPYLLHHSSKLLDLKVSYKRWRQGHPYAAIHVAGDSDGEDLQEDGDVSDEELSESQDDEATSSEEGSYQSEAESDDDIAGTSPHMLLGPQASLKHQLPLGRNSAKRRAMEAALGSSADQAMMGISYISHMTEESASDISLGASPCPLTQYHQPGGMSPGGAVPMSLGTPGGSYMHLAGHRLGYR